MNRRIIDDFLRRRRAVLLRAAAEAGIYPAIVTAWAMILSAVVIRTSSSPMPPLLPVVIRDGLIVAAVAVAGAPFLVRALHHHRYQLRWIIYWGHVATRLTDGAPLSVALVPDDTADLSIPRTAVAHGIARGTDPEAIVAALGCPEPYPQLVAEAASESDLENVLEAQLRQETDAHLQRLSLRVRLAQPVGILLAGAVVVWVVTRVVRPALAIHWEGLTI
ncbi:MAG: hypothetical protein ACOCYB_10825 [Alkalispirochaeta sp.]